MRHLGILVFAVMTAIAAVHVYWGLGFYWPFASEQALVNAVLGDPRATRIPPMSMTGVVAGALWLAGIAALRAGGAITVGWSVLARGACALLFIIFVARGASGFMLGGRILADTVTPEFKFLDFWFYSPLCIALGVAFGLLAWRGAR